MPCSLPPLPRPFKFVGFPSPSGLEIYVSKSDMAELAVYLTATREWIRIATVCLSESTP